jgi:hypothetical protein
VQNRQYQQASERGGQLGLPGKFQFMDQATQRLNVIIDRDQSIPGRRLLQAPSAGDVDARRR